MTYELDDFPVETKEPTIRVNLPIGVHTLELVVEDSAGLESIVDTVTIEVIKEQVKPPELDPVETPVLITRGRDNETLIIHGAHLATTCKLEFLLDDEPVASVTATIDFEREEAEGSVQPNEDARRALLDSRRILKVTALEGAEPTVYGIRVTTLGGSKIMSDVVRVLALPEIMDFAPRSLGLGETADPFVVRGQFLWTDGLLDRDGEHRVEFLREDGSPDEEIRVKWDIEKSSDGELVLLIEITTVDPDAVGPRSLRVSTPAGRRIADDQLFHVTAT